MKLNALRVGFLCSSLVFFSCATNPVGEMVPVASAAEVAEPKMEVDSTSAPVELHEEIFWRIASEDTRFPDGLLSGSVKNKWDESGFEVYQEMYDGKGRLASKSLFNRVSPTQVEIEVFSGSGVLASKILRTLADSRIIADVQMNLSGDELSREETEYDSEGNKIRYTVYSASGNSISTEYLHRNGRLSEIMVRDTSGKQIKRFVLSYNNEGILEKEEEFDLKDRPSAVIVYTNEEGFLVKEVKKNTTGGILSSVEYTNDIAGNPVETRYFDRRGRLKEVKTTVWQSFTRLVAKK